MIAIAAEALTLREYLLRRLGNGTASLTGDEAGRLGYVSAEGWRLFLAEEGCAAVVQQELIELGVLDSLSREARREIRRQALAEAQRSLSVRHQIAEVAKIARERRWRVVILKGGVGIAESSDVLYIHDLDVLTSLDVAPQLAQALRTIGYTGGDDLRMRPRTPNAADAAVAIELHRGWDPNAQGVDEAWWIKTRTLRQCPPLERPGDADHLWQMLLHVVLQHPERQGRLRDALLMWRVLAACDPAELAEVDRRIAVHASRTALAETLDFVRGLNTDSPSDSMQARAGGRYALRWIEMNVPVPDWARGQLKELTLSLADGFAAVSEFARRL